MKTKFVVSIVSHGHYDLIASNEGLKKIRLLSDVKIIIKDNLGQTQLAIFCDENQIDYLGKNNTKGFGENNNEIYRYLIRNEIIESDGWFLLINPDVFIEIDYFNMLTSYLLQTVNHFYVPNLFKQHTYDEYDNSLRYFPKPHDVVSGFLMKPINKPYQKDSLEDGAIIDWASGAFLCIRSSKFKLIGGFDERYFMYFEDVDLCKRLKQKGIDLRFLKSIKAVHIGQHANRRLFSKHFFWYLRSLLLFLFSGSKDQ